MGPTPSKRGQRWFVIEIWYDVRERFKALADSALNMEAEMIQFAPIRRSIYCLLYDFHFKTWKPRYVCFGLTFLAVFFYGIGSELLLGRNPSRTAIACAAIAFCGLVIGPLVYVIVVDRAVRAASSRLSSERVTERWLILQQEPQPSFLMQPAFVILVVAVLSLAAFGLIDTLRF
jgi:hypothetical protein